MSSEVITQDHQSRHGHTKDPPARKASQPHRNISRAHPSPQQHHHQQHQQQQHQQHHSPDNHGDSHGRKASQHGEHSPTRSRRISQYSKEITNTGHSHYSHHHENQEKHRRISQHSKGEWEDNHEKMERHKRTGHHGRDSHLKEATLRGHGRARAGSKKEHDRHSVATSVPDIEVPVFYENTYKLGPDAVFKPAQVKGIIKQVLQENLKGQKYEKNLMASRCLVLSDIIKEKIRQLNLDRFKIVTMVLIGEKKEQALLVSSRCLWNHDCDNFASCEYATGNLFAVGMVFAVYQE